MNLAENIKKLRTDHNMTQAEFGKIAGVTDKAVSTWEKGTAEPRMGALQKIANHFKIKTTGIIDGSFESSIPSNVSLPAAHAIPILGTICAGDGVYADENFDGFFFVDNSIRADCCLHVHGDSMEDAGIHDGDIAFLNNNVDINDGDICGVVLKDSNEAVLKKLYRADGSLILQPCNAEYKPIIADPNDVQIVGEMVGVYHKVK